ncbi:Vps52/Sac2 family protein [Histoplasma capsulatum G186AR]|uniref:Vps52/Sac2 family protein n=2 Tax=Ajellomyces capsulatus TaxID=5037 RepID=C0NSS2_AJECG|nr:Vps52/Sac2 family protein [Histoplasma capsulatum G186AR]EEH05938.1 Vps52/Sac2 family protein [Histoplasma capsulatum G186AR]KAG5299892.1 Vps52/Sac2 family protein [Histoplasma capsulatum]QSS67479.1 Vps52/Sac2 family protein [Histoplasma capsulatum G186AR]
MWLDRFSAHPSSASGASTPGPRGYSPARRPQHQQHLGAATQQSRPAFSPRSSSLSVSLTTTPNASSTSLPNTLRQASGSSFHRQNGSKPDQRPTGSTAVDPLEVLYGIIGKRPGTGADLDTPTIVHATGTVEATDKPECLVEDIDFGELSLEEFAQQKEESEEGKLKRRVDVQTIEQYERERDRFQDLHSAINGCDDVLKSVESYLSRFRTDLGAVSAEIESLQSRSAQLNSQLENRRNLERLLGPAVEDVSISPKVVHLISEGPINQEWVKALNEVETRSANIEANTSTTSNVRAVEDIKPLLSDLKAKAIERIRDYLVAQIKAIRSPNINAQIIQQQSLIKYKDLYGFLSRNHSALTEEIIQAYINTMRWYYLSNFTRYHQALEKLKVHHAERNDLLGGDPSAQKASNIFPSGRNQTYDPFALGRRMDILKSSQTALPSYLAEENASHATTTNPNAKVNPKTQPSIHGLEVPFRNFNLALIDNISAEYSFVAEMFVTKTQSLRTSSRRVIEMFEPVFALGHNLTKHLIDSSTDCLGILLCVRLNQHFAFELQRRKVPVADNYINGINMLLWPRFQMVMDLHTESIQRIAGNTTGNIGAILSLSETTNPNTSSPAFSSSSAPHFLTQRFGQFLQGILALSSEAGDDEPVSNSLARLRVEFDALLVKLAKAANGSDARGRERFLWSNYSLIGTIISDTRGRLAEEVKEHYTQLIKNSAGRR